MDCLRNWTGCPRMSFYVVVRLMLLERCRWHVSVDGGMVDVMSVYRFEVGMR
jgi:hypothetical protein